MRAVPEGVRTSVGSGGRIPSLLASIPRLRAARDSGTKALLLRKNLWPLGGSRRAHWRSQNERGRASRS